MRTLPMCPPVAGLLLATLFACDNASTPTDSEDTSQHEIAATRNGQHGDEAASSRMGEPFDDAEVFFEFNTTANDLGLQLFLDADGWRQVKVADPRGHKIVQIMAEGMLADLGITELRFESAEPSPAEVLALFRPGEYAFTGTTAEGDFLSSTATLSHDFLAAPTFSPSNGQLVNPNNTIVTWNAPGADRVEVIIENDVLGHVFDVIVSGTVTSLNVPPQFLTAGLEYKIEVLAIGSNGNRTIAESTFRT